MRIDYSTAMAVFTITSVLTVVGFVLLMKRKIWSEVVPLRRIVLNDRIIRLAMHCPYFYTPKVV
ncbi:hypothetical protein SAMN05660461_4818 [Chitinophaga ginsengisegetis]|uniref:Uncharacterized protein n=1 Tax=Chitinophaga ginsengisegetis TaxID=393003 RepID=A0A1T5P899_9BACT|nr:putative site-specific integrase-resolvase [Chitinophaga ginsengisegetis]MDR6647453.1 putative site-specific integrase-resolvase [Chitinophaga ginsengisegetis]MDR6653803.1 putative site-specific integrase-resolvase [Chitinophaga ginsengisegetis]SKD08941.1 hypothetical protein SAMN05660461_4818 [Chitinophaga ginsengisegetis]